MAFGKHDLKRNFVERVPLVQAVVVQRGQFPELMSLLRADSGGMKLFPADEHKPERWVFRFSLRGRPSGPYSNQPELEAKVIEVVEHDFLVWPAGTNNPYDVEVWDRNEFLDKYQGVSEGS